MRHLLKLFTKSEDGNISIDWVVLTGSLVGLGIVVLVAVGTSTTDLTDEVETKLDSVLVSLKGGQ